MGKIIATGKGQIVRRKLEEPTKGNILINGRKYFVEDYDKKSAMVIVGNSIRLDVKTAELETLAIKVTDVKEGDKKLIGKEYPVKFSQWIHLLRDTYRVLDIELVEVGDNNELVAKTIEGREKYDKDKTKE